MPRNLPPKNPAYKSINASQAKPIPQPPQNPSSKISVAHLNSHT